MCYLRCLFLVVLLAGLSACSEDNRGKGRKAMEDLATSELLFQEISLETILGRPFQIEIVDSILIIGTILMERHCFCIICRTLLGFEF